MVGSLQNSMMLMLQGRHPTLIMHTRRWQLTFVALNKTRLMVIIILLSIAKSGHPFSVLFLTGLLIMLSSATSSWYSSLIWAQPGTVLMMPSKDRMFIILILIIQILQLK